MPQRTRDRLEQPIIGSIYDGNGNLINNHTYYSRMGRCVDVVDKGNGHDLTINDLSIQGGLINARKGSGSTGRRYIDMRPAGFPNQWSASIYSHWDVPGRPSNNMLAAKLLASTNPSRPVVDLPLMLYELREIPSLLRKEGDGILRRLASLNLKYQFGIKPLVNDLMGLISFSDSVKEREQELQALHSGGLRRKRQLWSGTYIGPGSTKTLQSLDFWIQGRGDYSTVTRVWGFTEWKPQKVDTFSKADLREQARKAVLGLTVDFSTAWNAIPWSWLIDWCSNVGDLAVASRNLVGATHGPVWIMETKQTSCRWRYTAGGNLISPCSHTLTTKTRRKISNVSLSAQLPYLTWRQLSILGSIGVTRRKPGNL